MANTFSSLFSPSASDPSASFNSPTANGQSNTDDASAATNASIPTASRDSASATEAIEVTINATITSNINGSNITHMFTYKATDSIDDLYSNVRSLSHGETTTNIRPPSTANKAYDAIEGLMSFARELNRLDQYAARRAVLREREAGLPDKNGFVRWPDELAKRVEGRDEIVVLQELSAEAVGRLKSADVESILAS